VWRLDVQPAAEPAAGVFRTPIPFGAMYGREVIADLELRLAAGAELAERLHEEIEATALRHRIASRRTSLVAVAEEPSVDPREPRRREQLPLEMPAEMSAEGVGLFGGGHTGAFEINRLWLSETLFSGDFPPTALGKGFRRQGIVNAAEIVRWSPEALRRYQELSRIPASTSPTPAPSPTLSPSQETANAQLLRAGDRLVVIEFEVSRDGFSLPDVEMWVWFSGKVHGTAQRVPESSSPRGPHPRGTMVRLAMRMKKGSRWPQNGEIEVAWLDRGADGGRGVRFAFHFVIPRRSSP
jgi:hypothetical protein